MFTNRSQFLLLAVMLLVSLNGCSPPSDNNQEAAIGSDMEVAEALYKKNCKVCHAQGINGAPIVGNQKMWADRAEQGIDVLVEHAINGFGLMPPKGGKSHVTDEEVRLIVEYYLAQLKKS